MKKHIPINIKLNETSTGILTSNLYQKAYIFRRQRYKNRFGNVITDLNFSHCILRHNFSKARRGFSIAFQLYQFKQGYGWNSVRAFVLLDSINYTHFETVRVLRNVLDCLETINLQKGSRSNESSLLVLSPERGGFICLFIGLVGFLPWDSLPYAFSNFLAKKYKITAALSVLNARKSLYDGSYLIRMPFDEIDITIQYVKDTPNYKKQNELRMKELDENSPSLWSLDSDKARYNNYPLKINDKYENIVEVVDEKSNVISEIRTPSKSGRKPKTKISNETVGAISGSTDKVEESGAKKEITQESVSTLQKVPGVKVKRFLGDPFSFIVDSPKEQEAISPLFIIIFSKTPVITPEMEMEFR
jgi:hypothetical protein